MPLESADHVPTGPPADWPRPLAFVFSGGGAYGSVHVGMVRALLERDIRPDLVVGSSVGALNGAVLAADPDGAAETLTEVWSAMSRATVFGRGRVRSLRNLVRHRALCDFDTLGALIDHHLPVARFDDLRLRFGAVATCALSGEPQVLAAGRLKPALLASAAIPGVFPRVHLDGREFIDGGVTANVPLRQAIGFGARSIISLDATPPRLATRIPRSFVGGLVHAATLLVRAQGSHAVDDLADRYPIMAIPSVVPPDHGSFNFDHSARLIRQSYDATRFALDAAAHDSRQLQRSGR